ncbi:MAG TPA: methyltransferase [Chitinophagaceae bacterium]|nr:methyltransferase [Chitinophagaceae bacterium]
MPPEVFHPGFFYSTQFLLRHISSMSLQCQRFLELGAGSGLISIYAAKNGARVTATDINPVAIEYLEKNGVTNGVNLAILHSDLFTHIAEQVYDIIAINPPYYKKKPIHARDFAWYCGEKGEYFESLFSDLGRYTTNDSQVFMTLFEGCDFEMIGGIAAQNNFRLVCIQTQKNLLEKNFIYKIEKKLDRGN